jgi:hypothetical protein
VIDYRIWFKSTGSYAVLATGVTTLTYTASGLTTGTTYAFKVQARNSQGYSNSSPELTVLTAAVPSMPTAPTTEFILSTPDYVKITWTAPAANGAAISAYTIKIRTSNNVDFVTELTECDGSDALIMAQLYCIVYSSTLNAAPFSLTWGSSVYATVSATNS